MMKQVCLWLLPVFCFSITIISCEDRHARLRPVIAYERGEEPDNTPIVLENNFLELTFLPQTAEIILRDKVRGTEWRSNPADAALDTRADVVTRELMGSQFAMQYQDVSGVSEIYYSSSQSVELGLYEYELVDGALEVHYTIGNIPRSYLIPLAVEEERMQSFLVNMENADRRRVEDSYRLYDINKLRANENKNELLEQYPDLAREKLYVIRDNTPDFMREQLEEFFANAGYTREDYYEDAERFSSSSADEKPAFSITMRYALDGSSLVVSVPFDGIAYRGAFPIVQLDILPFMGAGGLNDEGYALVPDGSGALVYFNNGRENQNTFVSPVYGWDEAMPREFVVLDNKASFPAFGVQKNGNALLCVIEDGAAYANVRADVSGRNSSYNVVYPYFNIIHGAVMDISGRSDRAIYLYEAGLPQDEKITLRYTVCERDGYVGMAKEFRSWLLKKYPSLGNNSAITSFPIAVEIVGAVNKTQHILGIPFDLPLKLTSYREMENMVNDFARFGWKNVQVKLSGWFNRSYDHTVPSGIGLIGRLGGRRDFRNIISAAQKNNFVVYPEVDFMYMRDIRPFDGYNIYRDTSRYVSRKRVEKYPYSFVWFGERNRWGKLTYLARPGVSMAMIDNYLQKASSLGIDTIAFRNMGARLGGDYNDKRFVSREASMIMRQQKFEQLSRSGTKMLINAGFMYSVPWADFIVDMPLDDQGFGITDVAVPFYQIALHGLVPFTGRAINLAEDYTKNLLKTVESGAGLYFSFITEEAVELQETKFRQFYANEYAKWINDANALYSRFSSDFAGLYNQAIVDHQILGEGVTVTVYENGTRVLVNASKHVYNNVQPYSYAVYRQGE
jgi:hypothetical protein